MIFLFRRTIRGWDLNGNTVSPFYLTDPVVGGCSTNSFAQWRIWFVKRFSSSSLLFGSLLSLSEISISQSRLQAYHLLSGRRGSAALRCGPELQETTHRTVVFSCNSLQKRQTISLKIYGGRKRRVGSFAKTINLVSAICWIFLSTISFSVTTSASWIESFCSILYMFVYNYQ